MILVSSFYNEEYLLPWWCEHHKNLFKHGILFDYFSTDNSAKIIKEICPHWLVWPTANKDWDFADNDSEFMRTEAVFDDYKIVLTTTEFLSGDFTNLPDGKNCFAIPMVRMVDTEPEQKPVYGKALLEQKNIGYWDKSANRYRYLHNYTTGKYSTGRHKTAHKTSKIDAVIYKYVFSPWTPEFIRRKLAMKKFIQRKDLGRHHLWDKTTLSKKYSQALNYDVKHFNPLPQ